jgi:hypothetical protein
VRSGIGTRAERGAMVPVIIDDGILFRVFVNGTVEVSTPDGRSFVSRSGGASLTQRQKAEQLARDWCLQNRDQIRGLLSMVPKRSWWRRALNVA